MNKSKDFNLIAQGKCSGRIFCMRNLKGEVGQRKVKVEKRKGEVEQRKGEVEECKAKVGTLGTEVHPFSGTHTRILIMCALILIMYTH